MLKKNYESVVERLGGKKHAFRELRDIFLIEKNNQKIFVILQISGYNFTLSTVRSGGYKSILTASKLAEDFERVEFVTLNVNFDTNKSVIKDQDKQTLNEVVALLKNDSKLNLSVDGHTDNVGSAAANKALSQQRSESIVKYITNSGVETGRLLAKGFGSEAPLANNRSEEGKAKNRRVELVKIK